MTDQPTTRLVHAPWNAEQVTALNAFQHTGRMHPFTCGAEHASGQSPVLVATNGGWVCPGPQCTYRQDWAHAFMASPAVPVSSPPPDQTALRDRIADALHDHLARTADIRLASNAEYAFMPEVTDEERLRIADVVLAVLPRPADRAAVLLQAAEHLLARCPHLGKSDALRKCTCQAAEELIRLASQEPGASDYASAREDVLRRLAAEARQPDTKTRPSWTPGPVALARAADWATKRQDATVDPAMCPRCKGDNSEAFQLCVACATPEPPVHKGGNADDCPACQTDGLDTIGPPYECPGPERP